MNTLELNKCYFGDCRQVLGELAEQGLKVQTCVSFDLYGCIQVVVAPQVDKDSKSEDSGWFDVTRIEILSDEPVMQLPDFSAGYVAEGRKGAADKPLR